MWNGDLVFRSIDKESVHQSVAITQPSAHLASFPGRAPLIRTASDEKLGGAWERGYCAPAPHMVVSADHQVSASFSCLWLMTTCC